jgi:hypothetical protein
MAHSERHRALELLKQALDALDHLGCEQAAAAVVAHAIDLLESSPHR